MAKKKKEEAVVEETPQVVEQPKVDETVDEIKVKKKPSMKKFIEPDDNVTKVDLSSLVEKAEDIVKVDLTNPPVEEIVPVEEVKPVEAVDAPLLEEITDQVDQVEVEEVAEVVEKEIIQSLEAGKDLPEGVQKLMTFMDETGGDLKDYVSLNRDYSSMDNQSLLKEYYKKTKSHLDSDEIEFLMEDNFSFDEEMDDDREIKRKKLALKEQVASAKSHLDGLKSKYYEDIKAGSKLTPDQQKAIDFFNRHNKKSEENQKVAEKAKSTFLNKTDQVFGDKFKGFEFNVGDKKFRFNVKDADQVKTTQSDINNFVGKFLNEENLMEDASGYHKSLFTAMNSDAIANHFYEQGKADALKDSVAKSKNINMDPRQSYGGEISSNGIKARVLGNDASNFKFKIKKKK